MHSSTMAKTFKYTSSQQPMYSVIEPPLHYKPNFATKKTITTFEDLSFSSYIKAQDPSQIPPKNDMNCTMELDTELSIFDAQKYFSEINDTTKDVKRQQQHETPSSHDVQSVPRLSSASSVDGYGRNYRTRSFHATPTASSEASWNSQTGLLANRPGSVGVSLTNFPNSKNRNAGAGGAVNSKKWIFGRKCCCTGRKSVDVKEVTSDGSEQRGPVHVITNNNAKANYIYSKRDQINKEVQTMSPSNEIHVQQKVTVSNPLRLSSDSDYATIVHDQPRQQRVSASGRAFVDGGGGGGGAVGFSFPILNAANQVTTKPPPLKVNGFKTKPTMSTPLEDPPRDSLEVFQPISRPQMSINFNPGSPNARGTNNIIDDDVGSDASSDLFEIESFSTQTTSYPMYRRRDSLDEASTFNPRRFGGLNVNINNNNGIQYGRHSIDEPPTPSVAATECYAPSEISIDWSVTTAEGFDKASVTNFSVSASEIGKTAFMRQRIQEEESMQGVGSKTRHNNNNNNKGTGGGGGMLMMSCRHEKAVSVGPQPVKCAAAAMDQVQQVDGIGRPPRANKPPMGSSHSARLSLAFAA